MSAEGSPRNPPLDPFASAARMRELIEQLPVAVYVDSDDELPRCLYVSPTIARIVGRSPEQMMDQEVWRAATHPDDLPEVDHRWRDAWRSGSPFHAEYRMLRPDDEEVWVRESSVLVRGASGERLAWQGVLEDITAEKRSSLDVLGSEARYRALVERIPAVIYEMGPDDERRTLYVSPHVEAVLGYTREEWLDQPDIWIELLHADDREIVLDRHDHHSRTGEPWDLEYRLIASDGRVVWVHDRGTLIRGHDGQPAAWHGVLIDVTAEHEAKEMLRLTNEELERRVAERTAELAEANELMSLEIGERRRIEAELREARERFRGLIENLPGVAYTWEVEPGAARRRFTYVSPQVEQILGFAPSAWSADERVHPHDRVRVADAVARSAATGEPLRIECRYLAKDGSVVWTLEHATLVSRTATGEPHLFQGVMLSISARKEAESKAAQAEDRFRALTERGPVVAFAYEVRLEDPDRPAIDLLYISPHVADVTGYPTERWSRDPITWLDLVHPDDRERTLEVVRRSWVTGDDWSLRYRLIRADGEVIWVQSMGRMLDRDDAGRPWRFQGVLFDVTKEQDEAVRLERISADQRAALDGVGAIPWTESIDPESGFERYTHIGPQALEVLGYTPEELMVERSHFPRMVHPDDRPRIRASIRRAEETGSWEDEYRVFRRDGEIRRLRSFGRRVSPRGESPEIWQGVAIDVTALRPPGSEPADEREVERREAGPSPR
jgi:PAS domain S-box-containing protein